MEATPAALAVKAVERGGGGGLGWPRGGEVEDTRTKHISNHFRLEAAAAEVQQRGQLTSSRPCGCLFFSRGIIGIVWLGGVGRLRRMGHGLEQLGKRAEHALVALEIGASLAQAHLLLGAPHIPAAGLGGRLGCRQVAGQCGVKGEGEGERVRVRVRERVRVRVRERVRVRVKGDG